MVHGGRHTSQLHLAANTVLCWDRAGGTADCSGSAPMEAAARGAQQLRQLDWPTLAVTSPITSAFLLLVTVALWKLLNWIQQKAPSPASGGGAGRSAEARNLTSSGRGLPQQRGALAEVVKSHNEHWKREMPKTGAVSLAQAHALQWSAEDLGQVGSKEELPAYLWVVRSDHPLSPATAVIFVLLLHRLNRTLVSRLCRAPRTMSWPRRGGGSAGGWKPLRSSRTLRPLRRPAQRAAMRTPTAAPTRSRR
eukprot:COSAG06_NODE_7235_length_2577_cov_2.197337_1_plen_250_part_00